MTTAERVKLDAAIARAQQNRIAIMGRGYRKADGARVFAVSSASRPQQWHLVIVMGARLACTCPARGICQHRGIVHEELKAERERLERDMHGACVDLYRGW